MAEHAREWTEAWQYMEAFPAPPEAIAHAVGSDVQEDVPLLYALAHAVKPAVMVELGTRQGTSTRTLAYAARELGASFYTIDPDHGCRGFIRDIIHPQHCQFLNMTGEYAFESTATPKPDLLFVDTDPHTFDQTMHWMKTWVATLPPRAVAAFHDTVPARPEIQVAKAVQTWLAGYAGGEYVWRKFPTTYGLGILWQT